MRSRGSLRTERNTRSKAIGHAKALGKDWRLAGRRGSLSAPDDEAKHELGHANELDGCYSTSQTPARQRAVRRDASATVKCAAGEPRQLVFEGADHVAIAEGSVARPAAQADLRRPVAVLTGPGGKLHRALDSSIDLHQADGYREAWVPSS